jgi:hypothetical protein
VELRKLSRVPFIVVAQGCQVEIDVPYTEYQAAQPIVKSIMWPCQTVMDLVGGAVLHLIFRVLRQTY